MLAGSSIEDQDEELNVCRAAYQSTNAMSAAWGVEVFLSMDRLWGYRHVNLPST